MRCFFGESDEVRKKLEIYTALIAYDGIQSSLDDLNEVGVATQRNPELFALTDPNGSQRTTQTEEISRAQRDLTATRANVTATGGSLYTNPEWLNENWNNSTALVSNGFMFLSDGSKFLNGSGITKEKLERNHDLHTEFFVDVRGVFKIYHDQASGLPTGVEGGVDENYLRAFLESKEVPQWIKDFYHELSSEGAKLALHYGYMDGEYWNGAAPDDSAVVKLGNYFDEYVRDESTFLAMHSQLLVVADTFKTDVPTALAMIEGTTTVVVGDGVTDTGGGVSDINLASSNIEIMNPSTNSLDRWYATAGEGPMDVNWTVEVKEQGKYKVIVDGLPEWDLENAHVIISGISTYQLEKREHLLSYDTDSFDLSPGVYTFTIGNLGVPETPTINKAWFYLEGKPEEESRSHVSATYVMESKFIADHKEEFLDAGSIFQVQGVEGNMDVHGLINHFAPILHFHEDERFAVPFDVDEFLKENNIDMSGASDTDMDLSRYGLIDEGGLGGRFNEGNTESAVYASALWNEDKSEIAINYHFFFPRSDWGRYGGRNIHEGDWEGATVFLKSEEGEWAPDKVAVGQHIKLGTSDGGDRYEEDDERLAWEGSHIKLYVGLGGHALYTYSDVRNIWGLGEKHDGNIQYNSAENTIYITPLPCA